MSDTTAAAPPAKTKFCTKSWNDDGILTLTFGNGEVRTFDIANLPNDQRFNLMMHGASQKFGDSYASAGGDYTFAIAAAEKTFAQLTDDKWVASRATGTTATKSRSNELAIALARVKNIEVSDALLDAVEAASDEQRKMWRNNPLVAKAIVDIRGERALARLQKAANASADDINLGL